MPESTDELRISGIVVTVTAEGEVWAEAKLLGYVSRERRFDQWFWRAQDASRTEIKRFFSTRPEAIQLLLLRADIIEGIGF